MLLNSNYRQKSSHPHPTLSHSGGIIPQVPPTTHLGDRLSCSLLWSEHVSQAIQRVHLKIFTLKLLARRPGSCNLVKHLYLSGSSSFGICCACVELMLEAWLALPGTGSTGCRTCHITSQPPQPPQCWRSVQIGWPSLALRRRRHKIVMLWHLLYSGGPPRSVCEIRSPPLSLLGHTIFSVILCLFLSLHAALLAAWSLFSHLLLLCSTLYHRLLSLVRLKVALHEL